MRSGRRRAGVDAAHNEEGKDLFRPQAREALGYLGTVAREPHGACVLLLSESSGRIEEFNIKVVTHES